MNFHKKWNIHSKNTVTETEKKQANKIELIKAQDREKKEREEELFQEKYQTNGSPLCFMYDDPVVTILERKKEQKNDKISKNNQKYSSKLSDDKKIVEETNKENNLATNKKKLSVYEIKKIPYRDNTRILKKNNTCQNLDPMPNTNNDFITDLLKIAKNKKEKEKEKN